MKNHVRTLSDMNEYFESRGIKVRREYDRRAKRYEFHLTRNKFSAMMFFTYPDTEDREERYSQMTKACESMLSDFNRLRKMDEYCRRDIEVTKQVVEQVATRDIFHPGTINTVKKVIFNDPATIVFWSDGTKTVVKCSFNDIYDPEKGLAMAIAKKMFGNDNSFHKLFTKWLPKEEPEHLNICISADVHKQNEALKKICESILEGFYNAIHNEKRRGLE